jgi:phosphoglycolate phosphatase
MRKTILFDLDGTLTNPALGIVTCLKYALSRLGHVAVPDEQLLRFIGPPLQRTFSELLQTEDRSVIDGAVALYRERFSTVGLFENEVYDGVPALLATLRERGNRLFVATSKPTVYSERIVKHFHLTEDFDRVYGSELSGERADKAELIRYILDAERLNASQTLMVGDRSHDVLGARACGVATYGVLWGFGTRDELQTAGAEVIVETPSELTKVLTR